MKTNRLQLQEQTYCHNQLDLQPSTCMFFFFFPDNNNNKNSAGVCDSGYYPCNNLAGKNNKNKKKTHNSKSRKMFKTFFKKTKNKRISMDRCSVSSIHWTKTTSLLKPQVKLKFFFPDFSTLKRNFVNQTFESFFSLFNNNPFCTPINVRKYLIKNITWKHFYCSKKEKYEDNWSSWRGVVDWFLAESFLTTLNILFAWSCCHPNFVNAK